MKVLAIEATPNPNAMKFVVDGMLADRPTDFRSADAAAGHSLAAAIFALGGVACVFLLADFVTVNKTPDAKWAMLKPKVKRAIIAGF